MDAEQKAEQSAHELVTFGGVYGWRLYGRGDAAGGDRRHVYGKCCWRPSRRDKVIRRVRLSRDRAARRALV